MDRMTYKITLNLTFKVKSMTGLEAIDKVKEVLEDISSDSSLDGNITYDFIIGE